MPMVIVLSSFVAGSRVGGGVAQLALAPLKIDVALLPTVLLGRHPGWGAPGGGPVACETIAQMIDGVAANRLLDLADAVLIGYLPSLAHVALAKNLIARARAAPVAGISGRRLIVLDPIMGDYPKGLYLPEEVAKAIAAELVPAADLLTPNLFEFERLCGRAFNDAESLQRAALAFGAPIAVTSTPLSEGLGILLAHDGALYQAGSPKLASAPNGAGDLFAALLTGHWISGAPPAAALARAHGAVHEILRRAQKWSAPELPLAACQDVIANPHLASAVSALGMTRVLDK